ncbi:hypothetical protein [Victivallis sp. Marseille-Q1083]|uniref:hypothetical protein n=1 Tax=Victivallis sp. Marseille-Q1083 TaxID=2717288 RepID=UPI00158E1DA5|nr:hypothetical protein [Victivallis sp. Marseille-Q1083]
MIDTIKRIFIFLFFVFYLIGCSHSFVIGVDQNDVYNSMRGNKYILQVPCRIENNDNELKLIPLTTEEGTEENILPVGTELKLKKIWLETTAYYNCFDQLVRNNFTVKCYLEKKFNGIPTIFNVDELTLTKGNPAVRVEFDERYCKQVPSESE